MTGTTRRLATLAVAGIAAAAIVGTATVASAFPSRTSACTGCHDRNTAIVVTATQTANDGVNATYSVSVSNPWNDGVTGWTVFDGATNVRNGYGAGSFTVAVGKTYTVWGAAGSGGNGSNSITVSPAAPPPPPPPPPPADTTAPTVAVTAPVSGATVSGLVPLTANAADNMSGIARVEFRVDGVLVGTDTTAPYTGLWDATLAAPGSHTVQAKAFDGVGLSSTASIAVSIASPPPPPPVDSTVPVVTITSPASGATVAGNVTISANATDDMSGIARVDFKVDGVLVGSDTTAPYSGVWNATSAAPGSHTIQVVAVDGAGLTANTSIPVSIATPPPPPVSTKSDVEITVNSVTGTPVVGAKVVLRNLTTGTNYVIKTKADGTADFTGLTYGSYSVSTSARGFKRAVPVRFTVDTPAESVLFTLLPRR